MFRSSLRYVTLFTGPPLRRQLRRPGKSREASRGELRTTEPPISNLVPHSSRIALRNPEKRRDPLRTKTAVQKPYGAGSPRSANPPKGLRTAEVGGSNPL